MGARTRRKALATESRRWDGTLTPGGCSTRTLPGSASRDAALRRSSAWRLAEANALHANQRPKARWSVLGPLIISLRARIAPPS